LRQRHEQRRFTERQSTRLLAEIGERGGPHAFEIAAHRRQRQVEIEDLLLVERPFELERAHGLAQLDMERALLARLDQARHLHGECRAARDDVAMDGELVGRPRHGQRIDAEMAREALVLIDKERVEIARIDLVARGGQAPAA
jgi:hypothetical protein